MRYLSAVAGRKARTEQINTRLDVDELRTLKKLAKIEHRTPADTIRILIVRAGAAVEQVRKNGSGTTT
jgi:hypothetical protein